MRTWTFLLGFLLAAGFASAGVVRYGIESNGTVLPTRPVTNFTGPVACSDDADAGKTVCAIDAGSSGPTFWVDGGSGSMYALATVSTPDGGTGITFSTASGAVAASMANNGARLDFGTGTNDYAVSDATGISTPSYWDSTRAFSGGPGVIANSARLNGELASKFDTSNAGVNGAGSIAYNIDERRLYIQHESVDAGMQAIWGPVGQPHVVLDRQYLTTRIFPPVGDSLTMPQFAEKYDTENSGSPDYIGKRLVMYWSTGPQKPVLATNRFYYPLTTDAGIGASAGGYSASESNLTAFFPILHTIALPSMCQRIVTGGSVGSTQYTIGLAALTGAVPDVSKPGSAYFKYDNAKDTTWKFTVVTGSGGSEETDTTVPVAATTPYTLCAYQDQDGLFYAVVNGAWRVKSRLPMDVSVNVGPYIAVTTDAAAPKTLYVGPMQLEMN